MQQAIVQSLTYIGLLTSEQLGSDAVMDFMG
jgi:hypothetical protein